MPISRILLIRKTLIRFLSFSQRPLIMNATYGGGAGSEWTGNLSKSSRAGRVPESDGSAAEVDVVCKVVPNIGNPVDVPLGLTTDKPSQIVVRGGAGISVDPSVFHLSEMRLARQFVS